MLQVRDCVYNSASLIRDVAYDCAGVLGDGVRNSAHVLNSHYSPTGFLNFGKAAIASMKLYRALTESQFFNRAIDNFEHQKNLLYATMFFQEIGSFIVKDPHTGLYSMRWPQGKSSLDNWAKVLNAVGNFLEMVRCAMLYELVRTPAPLSRFGRAVGNISVPTPFGWHKFSSVPVLQTLIKKPKDFFIFTSSLLTVIKCIKDIAHPKNNNGRFWGQFSWEERCKVVSSIGKMVLISMGNWHGEKTWFRVADFVTQWASEMKFVISTENKWDDIQRRAAAGAA